MQVCAQKHPRPSKRATMAAPVRYLVENWGLRDMRRMFMRSHGHRVILEDKNGERIRKIRFDTDVVLHPSSFYAQDGTWVFVIEKTDGRTYLVLDPEDEDPVELATDAIDVNGRLILDPVAEEFWIEYPEGFWVHPVNGMVAMDLTLDVDHPRVGGYPIIGQKYVGRDNMYRPMFIDTEENDVYYNGVVIAQSTRAQVDLLGAYENDAAEGFRPVLWANPYVFPALPMYTRYTLRAMLVLGETKAKQNNTVAVYRQIPLVTIYYLWSWILTSMNQQ